MYPYNFRESLGYWICKTSQAYERALNEELSPLGITHRQFQVIGWLAHDGDLSQAQLAERMQIEAPTLAGILDRMERRGWIVRHGSAEDRRKKIIRPTPRVDPIWKQIIDCLIRVRTRATVGMSAEQANLAMRLLEQVEANLKVESPAVEEAAVSQVSATGDRVEHMPVAT